LVETPQERLFNLAANFPILARTTARIVPLVQGRSLTMVVANPLPKKGSAGLEAIMRPAFGNIFVRSELSSNGVGTWAVRRSAAADMSAPSLHLRQYASPLRGATDPGTVIAEEVRSSLSLRLREDQRMACA
jgi:hypothetical protein